MADCCYATSCACCWKQRARPAQCYVRQRLSILVKALCHLRDCHYVEAACSCSTVVWLSSRHMESMRDIHPRADPLHCRYLANMLSAPVPSLSPAKRLLLQQQQAQLQAQQTRLQAPPVSRSLQHGILGYN